MNNSFSPSDFQEDNTSEQLKTISMWRKQFIAIAKHKWAIFVIAFILLMPMFSALFFIQLMVAKDRYVAKIGLIFSPRTSRDIPSMSSQHLVEIIGRRAVREKLAKELNLSTEHAINLREQLEISIPKKNKNLIVISVSAKTANEAIKTVNAISNIAIKEYSIFRKEDLQNRINAQNKHKKNLLIGIRNIEKEMRELCDELGGALPDLELERLRDLTASQMLINSDFRVQLANEKMTLENIENQLANYDINVINFVPQLEILQNNIISTKTELFSTRQRYTEINPKIKALTIELNRRKNEYDQFLKENNIDLSRVPPNIIKYEENIVARDDSLVKIKLLEETCKAMQKELQLNHNRIRLINKITPNFMQLNQEKISQVSIIKEIEKDLAETGALLGETDSDLTLIEAAVGAQESVTFGTKKLSFAFILAGVCATFITGIVVLLQMFFGKIVGLEELQTFSDTICLGSYPRVESYFSNDDAKLLTESRMYFKIRENLEDKNIMFCGMFTGGDVSQNLIDSLLWNFAFNGVKVLPIYISSTPVNDEEIENIHNSNLLIVNINEQKGSLFMERDNAFSPAELELLKHDIDILNKNYDLIIFIRMKNIDENDNLFLDQIINLSLATIFFVGAQKTKWHQLRKVLKLVQDKKGDKFLLMTLLNNVYRWNRKQELI